MVIDPRLLRRLVAAAGLPDPERWVTHSLRHSFVTLELSAVLRTTGDVKGVQERARHRSRDSLDVYVHRVQRGAVAAPAIGALPTAELELPKLEGAPECGCGQGAAHDAPPAFLRAERAWTRAGRHGVRPAAITRLAEQAYGRAWAAAAERPKAERCAAGNAARRALLDQWEEFVRTRVENGGRNG
jgi:hypothetical protein